jgi:hypothetical protein
MQAHPSSFLRQFYLTTEDGGIGWNKTYHLVFTAGGGMFVRVVKDFEQPNKTPDIHEIYPPDFAKTVIAHTPLDHLVAKKVQDILPPTQ